MAVDSFVFDDHGAFARLAGAFAATGARAGAQAYVMVRTYSVRLQTGVKARAAGRPGPRMQTGDYNRSIGVTVRQGGGSIIGTVGTNKPQGRRLEFGFDGTDSAGRTYHQPAYKHFGPARDAIAPEFQTATTAFAKSLLLSATGSPAGRF
jgi:hypothetical protein